MKAFKLIKISLMTLLLLISCKKEDKEIIPSGIKDITSEALPGEIRLTWKKETPITFQYIKVSYFDKLLNQEVVRLASKDAEGITIPNTRAKFGEYKFTLQPYSYTNMQGNEYHIKSVSGPAPTTYSLTSANDAVQIDLNVSQLSTNAQEPREGPIKNILDDNINTFFHTAWSKSIPEMHYFQVDLNEPVHAIKFEFGTRKGNNSGDIKRMKIMVSADGLEWKEVAEQSFALNDDSGQIYSSTPILFDGYYRFIRFEPTARRSADPLRNSWFNLSIFRLYKVSVEINNPEA